MCMGMAQGDQCRHPCELSMSSGLRGLHWLEDLINVAASALLSTRADTSRRAICSMTASPQLSRVSSGRSADGRASSSGRSFSTAATACSV